MKTISRLLAPGILCFSFSLSILASEFRGLWVDSWSPGLFNATQISQLVSDARNGNFNALIVEVRRRGDAFYVSNFEPKNPGVASDFDPLADLIAKAHDTSAGPRLQVHCWIVTYPACMLSEYPPSQLNHPLNLHPEWRNKTSTGDLTDGHGYYFDPGHPEVQKHTFNVAMDIISRYDVDGLNWDYIRYPGTTWGYNDVSVARFNSKYGRTGQPSASDPLWTAFRRNQVTALVRKVYLSAISIKPHVVHSADVFTGYPAITNAADFPSTSAYSSVMQDWLSWMQEGILDLNIPMTYFEQPTQAQGYANWDTFIKNHQYNRHGVVGPCIGINNISNSIYQIRLTRNITPQGNRGQGVACYCYNSNNNENKPLSAFLAALTQPSSYDPIYPPVFASQDVPPEMPWKKTPTKGYLKGFVTDELNHELDGASIALSGTSTNSITTDATGFYGAVDLTPGNYQLTASYPGYGSTTQSVTITAGAVTTANLSLQPTGLTIVLQPQNRTVMVSSYAILEVIAAGLKPLHYQWYFKDNPIPDATNSTLNLQDVRIEDSGPYKVVVSNSSGSVTSLPATLEAQWPIFTSVSGNGAITLTPAQTGYAPGSSVAIAAIPAAGSMFSGWSGDLTNSQNPALITVTDAVRVTAHFVPSTSDVVIDNSQAAFAGTWTSSTSATDRYGADYHYANTVSSAATASATYRPLITFPGNYDISVWHSQSSNRATNAPWLISYEGGSTNVFVDQSIAGGRWVKLGSKYFAVGTNGYVRLSNNCGTGKVVIADAVRFVLSRVQPLVPIRFGAPQKGSPQNAFATSLSANSNQSCVVEFSTNLKNWQVFSQPSFFAGPVPVIDPGTESDPCRFYRSRLNNTFVLADFENNAIGAQVLFRAPNGSSTSGFLDTTKSCFTRVSTQFPQGNRSLRVLHVAWTFNASSSSPWLRLTSYESPVLPNPVVGFQQTIGFAVYTDRDLYLALGLRETSPAGPIGSNGGTVGAIEWVGGTTDNTTDPPKGRFIPAGQWLWVNFCIPAEPVRGFSGNGKLDSLTGKGVLEQLTIVPANGVGPYNLYIDDVQLISLPGAQ